VPSDVEGVPLMEEPLGDLRARLERERILADRQYHDALAAVDAAIQVFEAQPAPPPGEDATRLADLNRGWTLLDQPAPAFDRSWRGRLGAFVWRLVGPPLERQQAFNAALVDHLNRNAPSSRAMPEAVAELRSALAAAMEGVSAFESRLVQFLQTITAYVDSKDRSLATEELFAHVTFVEQRMFAVARELERLQAARPAAGGASPDAPAAAAFTGPVASTTYVGFEDRFRGSREDIARRVEEYLPLLTAHADVVDIGCGRGELLEALRARGVAARGIDSNQAMVEICRARGLEAEQADALSFLRRQEAGGLGGLVAIQVVEHFAPDYLMAVLAAAYAALRPGAPLVLETINPACWMAFFETYIRDPTHQQPLHPETLKYLVQASGFSQVDVQYRRPVGPADRLDRVDLNALGVEGPAIHALAAALNGHADKLNGRLFSSADYAVVGRR
jgi:SAM-dependent methyltransferase